MPRYGSASRRAQAADPGARTPLPPEATPTGAIPDAPPAVDGDTVPAPAPVPAPAGDVGSDPIRPLPGGEPDSVTITPPRIHISAEAVEKVREMLEEEDLLDGGGIRISALSGAGCSAPMHFDMSMEVAPGRNDVVLAGQGIRIFMDPTSAWSLDGLRVDWVSSPEMGEGFAFRHPRGASRRSC